MMWTSNLALGLLALSLSIETTLGVAIPFKPTYIDNWLADAEALVKRDLEGDVCGTPSGNKVGADTRNSDTWNGWDMVDYMIDITKPVEANDWKFEDGSKVGDYQSLVLHEMHNEGAEKCDEISSPGCTGSGLDYGLCKASPKAHFTWFAMTHFARFLNKLQYTFLTSTVSVGLSTSTLVKQFFVPAGEPSELILPVSLASGLAAALSSVWPPAAVLAGAGSAITGALTQAGLDKPDPIKQWGEVQTAVGQAFTQITKALDTYFKNTFHTLPSPGKAGPDGDKSYIDAPELFVQQLKNGAFAQDVTVGSINKGVYGALGASAINALWIMDKVMIIKISDRAYGNGNGAACKAFPKQTECIDGVAYIFVRFQIWPGDEAGFQSTFDKNRWFVFGINDEGKGGDGSQNANHLDDYGLTLRSIALASEKTQKEHGFLYADQNGATIRTLTTNPTDLKQENIMFFNLPICDIDAIIGPNKHLNKIKYQETNDPDDKIVYWGYCTCLQAQGWPKEYTQSMGLDWSPEECRKYGWADD